MLNLNQIPTVPKFFGRRKGRVVRKAKQFLLENMLPQMRVTPQTDFNVKNLFASPKREICLEIGFGDGQHLFGQALKNPQNGYIGVEVFQNGVANLLTLISGIKEGDNLPDNVSISDYNVQNVKVFDDDVRLLFKAIPDAFFDRVYLLFPDPWPKNKHAGRQCIKMQILYGLLNAEMIGAKSQLIGLKRNINKRQFVKDDVLSFLIIGKFKFRFGK